MWERFRAGLYRGQLECDWGKDLREENRAQIYKIKILG